MCDICTDLFTITTRQKVCKTTAVPILSLVNCRTSVSCFPCPVSNFKFKVSASKTRFYKHQPQILTKFFKDILKNRKICKKKCRRFAKYIKNWKILLTFLNKAKRFVKQLLSDIINALDCIYCYFLQAELNGYRRRNKAKSLQNDSGLYVIKASLRLFVFLSARSDKMQE